MTDRIDSVEEVRVAVVGLAAALRTDGGGEAARRLEVAAAQRGPSLAEELLVMREALVVTRPRWEMLPEGAAARRALAAAKRIAIEL